MRRAEGTVGSDSASDDEDAEKNAFYTPEKGTRSDDGEKNLQNSDNESTSTTSLLHEPSQLQPRAIQAGAELIGSPVGPDPDAAVATMMPGHPEVQQSRIFPNFPSEAQMEQGYDSDGFHDCCH